MQPEWTMTNSDPESPITDLTQAIGLLIRRVRAATASHELSLTESAVLGRLARGGPATTADLARAEAIKPQSMGTTLAGLAERGLVERRPHPTDGRQMLVELTAAGGAMRERLRNAKHSWLAQAIAELEPQEQATLFAAGEILKRLAER